MVERNASQEVFRDRELEILKEGLVKAGDLCLQYWRREITAEQKGTIHEIVTIADMESEQFIKEWLKKNFPQDQILSEESPVEVSGRFWVIDPLDGTSFFQRGLEDWSVTGALVEDGEVLLGVTYCPVKKELFYAKKGNGAFLNGQRILISEVEKCNDAIVNIGQRVIRTDEQRSVQNILRNTRSLWTTGSTALVLANLAAGRIDVAIQKEQSFWDIAAGIVLVKEAGGKFTNWEEEERFDYSGARTNNILATNGLLHSEVLTFIKK